MAFTDDDLARLKEFREKNIELLAESEIEELKEMIGPLIERLETSEQCCGENHKSLLDPKKYGRCVCEAHEAWRKACRR
jgi:hypothetical protein